MVLDHTYECEPPKVTQMRYCACVDNADLRSVTLAFWLPAALPPLSWTANPDRVIAVVRGERVTIATSSTRPMKPPRSRSWSGPIRCANWSRVRASATRDQQRAAIARGPTASIPTIKLNRRLPRRHTRQLSKRRTNLLGKLPRPRNDRRRATPAASAPGMRCPGRAPSRLPRAFAAASDPWSASRSPRAPARQQAP